MGHFPQWPSRSEADTEAVRLLVQDNFIVSLWGVKRPWTRQLAQWARRFAGSGASLHACEQGADVVRPDQLVTAWGHALSKACGAIQFSDEPGGGEVKRMHAGLGARHGVLAAAFAQLPAVTAPMRAV